MAKQILGAVLSPVGALLGLGGGKKTAATPPIAPGPKIMPLADSEAVQRARRKSIAGQLGRGGRSSTILSDQSETLGG